MKPKGFLSYLGVTAGSFLVALALVFFLIPHKIAAGGVSGLATIGFHVLGLPVGLTIIFVNIPLFLFSLKELGLRFGLRTLYGSVILSLIVGFLEHRVSSPTNDSLLAAIYGGLLAGIGLGVVFRSRGTTGGTDVAAQLLRHHFKYSSGQTLLAIDGAVIALAGWAFGVELALYALLSLAISSYFIDLVQDGAAGYVKAALIISRKEGEIAKAILFQLNRGATALAGRGLYTSEERDVLLCVVSRAEVTKLKTLVRDIDPQAFIILTTVHEALGEGFKQMGAEDY